MEAAISSKTSFYNKPTRRHIPEDGVLRLYLASLLSGWISLPTSEELAASTSRVEDWSSIFIP
jgi:hypothetical protein